MRILHGVVGVNMAYLFIVAVSTIVHGSPAEAISWWIMAWSLGLGALAFYRAFRKNP